MKLPSCKGLLATKVRICWWYWCSLWREQIEIFFPISLGNNFHRFFLEKRQKMSFLLVNHVEHVDIIIWTIQVEETFPCQQSSPVMMYASGVRWPDICFGNRLFRFPSAIALVWGTRTTYSSSSLIFFLYTNRLCLAAYLWIWNFKFSIVYILWRRTTS